MPPLQASGLVVLRTPLLPFDEFLGWSRETTVGEEDDLGLLRARLAGLVSLPELRAAIEASSPEVGALVGTPDAARVERALVRYVSRATGRATPFRLLAGISVGRIGERTRLELEARSRYERRARLSIEWLLEIAEGAARQLPPEPNPTAYAVGDRVRFIRSGGGSPRPPHQLVELRGPGVLETLAGRTHDGDAAEELVRRGLLIRRLRVPLTGPDELRVAAVREHLPQRGARHELELAKPGHVELPAAVAAELARGIDVLQQIGRPPQPDVELARFAARLADRFGTEEVPFLEAVDLVTAVPAPDLDAALGPQPQPPAEWGRREELLLERVTELAAAGADELVLGQDEIERLAAERSPVYPEDVAVIAVLAARSAAEVDAGRYEILLKGLGGPAAAGLVARAALNDPVLEAAVRAHVDAAEAADPDVVHAEIVGLPHEPHGDLLVRPVLRRVEIECLGDSGAPEQQRVPLSDLLVSAVAGEILLRSRTLGVRLEPRLDAPHNFEAYGPKPYRLLCKLQGQGARLTNDVWGPLRAAAVLPRVRTGRVVLERRRWLLRADALDAPSRRAVRAWAAANRVPRLVALTGADQELPADFENALSLDSLLHDVRARGSVHLVEWFPEPERLLARGPEGRYVHELFIPYVRTTPRRRRTQQPQSPPTGQRRFPPSSEWVYAKLFTTPRAADDLVLELAGDDDCDWFFARYDEPAFHLRIRFHSAATREQVEARSARLITAGTVSRFELGTYEREVERYGGWPQIEAAERVFHADSIAAAALIRAVPGNDDARRRAALVGVHRLLLDFGLDLEARRALVANAADALHGEVGANRPALGRAFRRERAAVEQRLADDALAVIFDGRSARLRPLVETLQAPASVVASFAHVHVNRVLRDRHREHELVINEFLRRLYDAEQHR